MLSASKTVASHARTISLRNARPSSSSSITRTVSPEEVEDLLHGTRAYRAASCAARWIYEARVSLPTCATVPLPTGVGTMVDTEIRSSVELS